MHLEVSGKPTDLHTTTVLIKIAYMVNSYSSTCCNAKLRRCVLFCVFSLRCVFRTLFRQLHNESEQAQIAAIKFNRKLSN